MSSVSEKDKERLAQAAKIFFFCIQDLASFTNTFIDLFNCNMNTQILSVTARQDCNVNNFFEQMVQVVKEMQSVVDAKHAKMQKEPLYSKIATTLFSMVEKDSNLMALQQSAKELFKNNFEPAIVSLLNSSHILGSLETSLSLLMKCPIMNLQLSDFYRKDIKEQSDATTSEESMSPRPSENTITDTLKKLAEALKTENAKNTIESAADQLEQIVKTIGPNLEILKTVTKTMETNISELKKDSNE
ncbi:uncharacterized protein C12orf60 homolog [Dasypus novemcinctus]|uniref:uncharacterized protein C12orf60 homolog n=1 Tax=Dasypus novemcinctus TaxID=9361 RepID=UPI0000E359E7|nr:uncharacterized protein C12orf60 homolog [Dasypus novemcinctus]XP_058138812.1 uncharacterized protein C12orf60 homolog [Dasypus novemcinctus]XP_058138813.1 uncharacterized protein C12orf60 homolog [Dasypus novemcinctus]